MRLDHIAYRCHSRVEAAEFFENAFGYRITEEFDIDFDNGEKAKCIALTPKNISEYHAKRTVLVRDGGETYGYGVAAFSPFHMSADIFVSDGTPDSVVGRWVAKHGNGIHHLAYEVKNVKFTMQEWLEKGLATFTTDKPMECPGLVQVFTNPHPLTGMTYEFIKREGKGFCAQNVKNLMVSSDNK
jgi:4-hydroxyphenylpyruvate dioxygenase-like putative hemolysin